MKKISPTQRTLAEMRERGYACFITEYWHAFTKTRRDLAGFIDVICLGENEVIAVQTTSISNVSARVKKIAEHENVAAVRKAGIRIVVMGWGKNRDGKWICKEVDCS